MVSTRRDRRFHRTQLKPGPRRRHAARRRVAVRGVLGLVLAVAAALWLADRVRQTPWLAIETILVEGNDHLSDGEVEALVTMLEGQNILVADLEHGRDSLLASGWVEGATLRRILPSTIEVTVHEREPVGLGRFGAQLYVVDAQGRIIDEHGPRVSVRAFPIIDGLDGGGDGAAGRSRIDDRRAALATGLLVEVGRHPSLSDRISQIDVSNPHDAVVLLDGDPALIHVGDRHFAERLQRYVELEPSLRAHVSEVDYVDLRFDRRIYIGPAESADRSGRAARRPWSAAQ